jgi:5-formyltetrahydrofolate cyclo-ligase
VTTGAAAEKAAMRARIRAARRQRPVAERASAGDALAEIVLGLPEISTARVVAAYLNTADEPGTAPLLRALVAQQRQVLLPVQAANGGLDWAWYDGDTNIEDGPHGISEPTGARLGADAIAQAQAIVVPALAVDRRGRRLGQGGGGYDRALARADQAALLVALLYDGELVDEVPTEAHDVAVHAVAAPSDLIRLGSG